MAIAIVVQTGIIKNSYVVENRPYLYADIIPVFYFNGDDHYAGAIVTYKNVGGFTASDIETDIKIGSNLIYNNSDLKSIPKYYNDTYHSYPYFKTIFPNQIIPSQKHTAHIGNKNGDMPKLIFVAVRIKYKGFAKRFTLKGLKEDKYFYSADVIYKIENVDKARYTLLDYVAKWDMNENDLMPEIDWEKYKSTYQDLFPEPKGEKK